MFVEQRLRKRLSSAIHLQRLAGEPRDMIEERNTAHRVLDVAAPAKGTMIRHQHRRAGERIAMAESLENHTPGVLFVIILDLGRCEHASARHAAMKIIGMGGSQSRQGMASLGPCRGVKAVRMGDPSDLGKRTIKNQVSSCVGAWL